jgi:hypothetical protein
LSFASIEKYHGEKQNDQLILSRLLKFFVFWQNHPNPLSLAGRRICGNEETDGDQVMLLCGSKYARTCSDNLIDERIARRELL